MKSFEIKNIVWIGLMILSLSTITGCSKDDDTPEQPKVEAIVSQFGWYSFNPTSDLKFYEARVDELRMEDNDHELRSFPIDEVASKETIANAQVLVYVSKVDLSVASHPRTFHRLLYTAGTKKISVTNKGGVLMLTASFNPYVEPYNEEYYFSVIILPKDYKLPGNLDLDNFDEVADYFKIDKNFGLLL